MTLRRAFFGQLFIYILSACATHQSLLDKKYPFARLTQDYGILNEDDLWISEQSANPEPLSEKSFAYPYWQCFPAQALSFHCEDLGKDHGIPMFHIEIFVDAQPGHRETFEGRRGVELEACQYFMKNWKAVTQGEKYACISGLHPLEETQVIGTQSTKVRSWTYDRLKTKKGCVSYFDDYCDANYWRKQKAQ